MLEREQILAELTDEQREAVAHVDGPLLIIAGAGSGKTRVITRRVAYLLSLGVTPSSILAITFTNKAAGEMKSRVSSMLASPLRDFGRLDQPWPIICTFHSLGLRILRHFAAAIGLPPGFSVYDSSDQQRLIKEAIKQADLDPTHFTPSVVHDKISHAKNRLINAEAYAIANTSWPEKHYARVYANYQQLLKQNNAFDFDDLLLRVAETFKQFPNTLKELQARFQYILIDEYQDTNHAQYVIAHALALKHRNICVVGDPDQSIYAWRGADIQNILDFEQDYADAKVVRLERNYRSTQTILDVASDLIARNTQRKPKRLWTDKGDGEKVRLLLCLDERSEAQAVADLFRELHRQGRDWSQMAVFYRINALSRVMEDALRRAGVPYRIARGVDFYHRKEIKDVLAYLRVIANPADELSLTRIINTPPRGIGETTIGQLQARAMDRGWTLWQALCSLDQLEGISSRAQKPLREFVAMLHHWQGILDGNRATGAIEALLEDIVTRSGIEAHLEKTGGEERAELANVEELITSAAQFDQETPGTLDDYLAQVSLVSDVDTLAENGGAVTLLTLHAAKGLEFPVVAMIGLEEMILPHARVQDHPDQIEEERRLCFVGITRAEDLLFMTKAARRTLRGQTLPTAGSRFLAELPASKLEVLDATGFDAPSKRDVERVQAQIESDGLARRFRPGQRVRHDAYGVGKIIDISEMGQHTRVVVQFDRVGRKNLILPFARLKPVN